MVIPIKRCSLFCGAGRLRSSPLWIGARGAITPEVIKLFLIGLPALFVGTWLGMKLFGRLDEATFRKIVLALLLVSGALLMV